MGKAIVTTPCTGMVELLGDSEYGLIINASEDGLCKGLKELLNYPHKAKYYAIEAKKRSKTFEKKKVVEETERLFLNEFQNR